MLAEITSPPANWLWIIVPAALVLIVASACYVRACCKGSSAHDVVLQFYVRSKKASPSGSSSGKHRRRRHGRTPNSRGDHSNAHSPDDENGESFQYFQQGGANAAAIAYADSDRWINEDADDGDTASTESTPLVSASASAARRLGALSASDQNVLSPYEALFDSSSSAAAHTQLPTPRERDRRTHTQRDAREAGALETLATIAGGVIRTITPGSRDRDEDDDNDVPEPTSPHHGERTDNEEDLRRWPGVNVSVRNLRVRPDAS